LGQGGVSLWVVWCVVVPDWEEIELKIRLTHRHRPAHSHQGSPDPTRSRLSECGIAFGFFGPPVDVVALFGPTWKETADPTPGNLDGLALLGREGAFTPLADSFERSVNSVELTAVSWIEHFERQSHAVSGFHGLHTCLA